MWRWDIFCKVVDNYGDIGVGWRLAQQLAGVHAATVRMWVDDLQSFARLCPAVSTAAARQRVGLVEICQWQADFPAVEAADVAIEAFGCNLPESYIATMAQRAEETTAPAWIILEYLSAEAWVEDYHGLPSLRTRWPLDKYFFFPGFTPRTGGLLRERDLPDNRAAFNSAAETQFWSSLGVPPRADSARDENELRVSMFCYENRSLADLLECWADGPQRVALLAAPGPGAEQAAAWFGQPLVIGAPLRQSALTVYPLPMLMPSRYDRLLWSCDVNFVRGEDSFVRAQWAGKPFVWQIYPQTEKAHLVKLEAFLARFLDRCEIPSVVRKCWQAWNGKGQIAAAWPDFAAKRKILERHGELWINRLDQNGDLADNLVRFVRRIQGI